MTALRSVFSIWALKLIGYHYLQDCQFIFPSHYISWLSYLCLDCKIDGALYRRALL